MSFLADAKIVINALNDYYQQSISRESPVIDQIPIEQIINDLELASYISTGELSGENLSQFITQVSHPKAGRKSRTVCSRALK